MPVDTSIYADKQVQPLNPLTTVGQFGSAMGALNQNRLFQQTINTNLGLGQIYKNAIDPNTGQIDPSKVNQLIQKDPNVTLALPQAVQQSQGLQSQQIGIATQRLDQAQKSLKGINDALGSLLSMPNPSQKDVVNKAAELISAGGATPQGAAAILSGMPSDPAQIKPWLTQHMLQNLDSQAKVQALYGQVNPVNTGGQTNFIQASPLGGVHQVGSIQNTQAPAIINTGGTQTGVVGGPNGLQTTGSIPNTLPPTTPVFNPNTRQMGYLGSPAPGGASATPGGAPSPSAATPVAPGPASPMAPGGAPAAPAPGQANGGPTPSAPSALRPAPPQQGIASAPPLGAEAAANVAGVESAKQGITLQQTADNVPARKAALGEMDAALNNFTPGPTADLTKETKALALRYGLPVVGGAKGVAAQEEFTKLGTQIALQQISNLGGVGTDDKLGAALQANPNTALSKLGNKQIIQILKGNEDAIAVKNQEWQNWQKEGGGPQDYGQFSTEFNKAYDPRVFQSTYMTPDQRQDLLKGMSAAERVKFRGVYNQAVSNGWIPDPRAPQAAPQ